MMDLDEQDMEGGEMAVLISISCPSFQHHFEHNYSTYVLYQLATAFCLWR